MPKKSARHSISTHESKRLLHNLLRTIRTEAGLRQVELAARLRKPQSYVSKYESGERRLDILELREVCRAVGIEMSVFVARLDGLIAELVEVSETRARGTRTKLGLT